MKAAESRRSHSRLTPVRGSASSGAMRSSRRRSNSGADLGQCPQPGAQSRLALHHLGPWRVEEVVRQPVDACPEVTFALAAVGKVQEFLRIAEDQIEAVVAIRLRLEFGEIVPRALPAGQEVADEFAARGRIAADVRRITVVRQRGETSATRDAQPGAAGFEVASGQHIGCVKPKVSRRSTASEELVAIRRHHQRVLRVGPPRDQDQAHDRMLYSSG